MIEMIVSVFSTLDLIARVVGWGTILYGIITLWGKSLEENRLAHEKALNQKMQFKFERTLRDQFPLKYERYEAVKESYRFRGESVAWEKAAFEAGITEIEYYSLTS